MLSGLPTPTKPRLTLFNVYMLFIMFVLLKIKSHQNKKKNLKNSNKSKSPANDVKFLEVLRKTRAKLETECLD